MVNESGPDSESDLCAKEKRSMQMVITIRQLVCKDQVIDENRSCIEVVREEELSFSQLL